MEYFTYILYIYKERERVETSICDYPWSERGYQPQREKERR